VRVNVLKARTLERSRHLWWRGEMASGEVSDGFDTWDELATGVTEEDTPVRVRPALWLHLPNHRIRDPNVR
jgi:hypothetical protein